MQVGIITVDGRQVGVINWSVGQADTFTPDLSGYEPMGRADSHPLGAGTATHAGHHPAPAGRHGAPDHKGGFYRHHAPGHTTGHQTGGYTPRGEHYQGTPGHAVHHGSADTDQAIQEAARAHHLDVNTMRSIASIESSMNPTSNEHRSTQYKGLYQIGRNEWARFGNGGDIYNAHDNAMGAARMFEANRAQFRAHYGRDPTDTELYMMHQQGLGFYTRGAMTNIGGNPYPGMHGAQSHESFEEGWGREVARRKAAFARDHQEQAGTVNPEEAGP